MEQSIREAVREFLDVHVGMGPDESGDDSLPLIDSGILTSLQTVELVMFLEERFEIEIEPDDVTEDNFQSVASIASFLGKSMSSVA